MTTISQDHICFKCAHYLSGVTCKAFPAIPVEIWHSNDHSKPVAGDHGLRFKPKTDPKKSKDR